MGMSIDEALGYMPCLMEACSHCLVKGCDKPIEKIDEAKLMVIETMRKYQQLQADYENRLKADMVAMLEEIDLQFDEICFCRKAEWKTVPEIKAEYKAVIQQKINSLKED